MLLSVPSGAFLRDIFPFKFVSHVSEGKQVPGGKDASVMRDTAAGTKGTHLSASLSLKCDGVAFGIEEQCTVSLSHNGGKSGR